MSGKLPLPIESSLSFSINLNIVVVISKMWLENGRLQSFDSLRKYKRLANIF